MSLSNDHTPTVQEKFEKAVNVIRNLPKNGSFQPSYELQLKFYAYFKQATEGPNNLPKPSFWEVVKRAKWDAWEKLGNMTKEEAMTHYVEELQKIVETMSYTDNVATFLNSLDSFYEQVPVEDLDILIGPVMERIRSRPDSPLSGSPLASRDTSPSRAAAMLRDELPKRLTSNNVHAKSHITSSLETSPASSSSASPQPPEQEDEEEEHFLDTQMELDRSISSYKGRAESTPTTLKREDHGLREQKVLVPPSNLDVPLQNRSQDCSKMMSEDFQSAVSNIKKDIELLSMRMLTVENAFLQQANNAGPQHGVDLASNIASAGTSSNILFATRNAVEKLTKDIETIQRRMAALENRRPEATLARRRSGSTRWGLSLRTTSILLAWPLILLLISKMLSRRRRH